MPHAIIAYPIIYAKLGGAASAEMLGDVVVVTLAKNEQVSIPAAQVPLADLDDAMALGIRARLYADMNKGA